jgi:hypothetical protein
VPTGITTAFLNHAAEVLATGLSGSQIVSVTSAFAADFGVDIPHASYPFEAGNKRTALFENLKPFSPEQQYQVIHELCDRVSSGVKASDSEKKAAAEIKLKLMSQFGHFATEGTAATINSTLVLETRHWLDEFPAAKKLYDDALQKHKNGVFTRNALDDLRLSLETLLKKLFSNEKSLENQVPMIGAFIKDKNGSPELANMIQKLVDYFSKDQNTYVKHNDAVLNAEVDVILELTSSLMKHLVQLRGPGES